MEYSSTDIGNSVRVVALVGRLDAPGAAEIETQFTALVSAGGTHVLLDMSGVSYVGSLGIRLLISNARVLQRRGLRFVIFGAGPQAMEVFETVDLATLIPILPSRQEALAALG